MRANGSALNMASLDIFLLLFKSIDVTHTSCPLLSSCLLYKPRVLLDIFTLTDDARLAVAVSSRRRGTNRLGINRLGWPTNGKFDVTIYGRSFCIF